MRIYDKFFLYDLLIREFHIQTQIILHTNTSFDYQCHTYDSQIVRIIVVDVAYGDEPKICHKHMADEVMVNGGST